MTALIKRFVGWVKVVQRGFRRVQMMRRARVEALLERFLASKLADPACAATARHPAKQPQPPIAFCCAPPAKAAVADRPQSLGPQSARGTGRAGGAALLPPRQPGTAGPPKSARATSHETGSFGGRRAQSVSPAPRLRPRQRRPAIFEKDRLFAFEKDFVDEELLPKVVRIHVLQEHVKEMQRTLPDRMKAWRERCEAMHVEEDIRRMGLGSGGSVSLAGPMPKSLEFGCLRALYASTYDAHLRGAFRYLVFARHRVLQRAWHTWRRRTTFGTLEESMPPQRSIERSTDSVGSDRRPAGRPDSASLLRRLAHSALVTQPPGAAPGSRRPSCSSKSSSRRPSQDAALELHSVGSSRRPSRDQGAAPELRG